MLKFSKHINIKKQSFSACFVPVLITRTIRICISHFFFTYRIVLRYDTNTVREIICLKTRIIKI